MCGRIASNISGADQLIEQFQLQDLLDVDIFPRYNVAPRQQVLAVVQDEQGGRKAVNLRWGLVPSWAKEEAIGYRMINARCETVATKPAFRNAFRYRRCVIPASGFYEWRRAGKQKEPYFVRLRSGKLMALAGLWEVWHGAEPPLLTTTIITTGANAMVAPIHDRMPVILSAAGVDQWLDHSTFDLPLLTTLMQPYPAEELEAYRVSPLVNSPKNDVPECMAPLAV
jgi:putative SOS response-associated peptidase YedK